MRSTVLAAAVVALGLGVHAPALAQQAPSGVSWVTERARELTAQAQRHAQNGDVALALRYYTQAIQTDQTYGPAYLGLAWLRQVLGDYDEADHLYQLAARLPDVAPEASARRAVLLRKLGRSSEAIQQLESAVRADPGTSARLTELAKWYAEKRAWPAALAVYRQLLSALEASEASAQEIARVRVQVQALTLLADSTDPVTSGRNHSSWVRRALSSVARRTVQATPANAAGSSAQAPRQLAP